MNSKKPGGMMLPPSRGLISDLAARLKLIARLIRDPRVNFLLKALPIGALAYLISPIDFIPGVVLPIVGALDDAAVISLGAYLFVELCPPNIVNEHMRAIAGETEVGEVVDAEATDIPDDKK